MSSVSPSCFAFPIHVLSLESSVQLFVSLTGDAGARGFATVKLMFTLAALWHLFVVLSFLPNT